MRTFVTLVAALSIGCPSEKGIGNSPATCPEGSLRCPCHADGSCDNGMVCSNGRLCARVDPGDGGGGDPSPGDGPAGDPAGGDPSPGDAPPGDPLHTNQGVGDPCSFTAECRSPLICDTDDTCQPSGSVGDGGDCALTADCDTDLFCDNGTCTAAGGTADGDRCSSTAECAAGLTCAFEGLGGTCRPGGSGDLGDSCTERSECAAGLVCDPQTGACEITLSAPAGDVCTLHSQCAPLVGIYCLPSGVCGGYGPDAQPVPPWLGATCPTSETSTFRVLFEVGNTNEDFFRLPFPNDARMAGGSMDLTGFPVPPSASVPIDLMPAYIAAIEAEQDGFGPNQSVFLRFSHAPLFCEAGCSPSTTACATGCMGGGEPGQSVYVYDLTTGNRAGYLWRASTGDGRYLCGPWLALAPSPAWSPGHTYAVFVHGRILGSTGETQVQDADFTAMLGGSLPGDARLQAAWNAYQPLRDWLATSPVYPSGDVDEGQTILGAHLGGAAVFTVRDPTGPMVELGDAVEAVASFSTGNLVDCTDPSSSVTCFDTTSAPFIEIQGEIDLPIYQAGTAPYPTGGGVASPPVLERTEAVRFSLSVPTSAQPTNGWPLVVYAHGTGGDYQSHLRDGTAARLAQGAEPAAVLGIDQVGHGPRRGASTQSPHLLFFNFANPQGARGNVLQSAADQLSLLEAVADLETGITGLAGQSAFLLDDTRLAFVGHSQGSTSGVLAMARASTTRAAVLSGAGGKLLTSLQEKTSPYDLLTVVELLLADPSIRDTWTHPALSLIQGYMEDADPVNYGWHISAAPLAGSVSKHVLHVVGIDDTFTPNATSLHLVRRLTTSNASAGFFQQGDVTLDDDATGFGAPLPVASADLQGNFRDAGGDLTIVLTVHAPSGGADGHFVMFDDATAGARVEGFVSDYLADPSAVPIVAQ